MRTKEDEIKEVKENDLIIQDKENDILRRVEEIHYVR